jgi:hypothetical protein
VQRAIISIHPRWEGGYDVYLRDEWVGSGLTVEQVRAVAQRKAEEEAAKGQVGLVVMKTMGGDIHSVDWVDPPRDVIAIPDAEAGVETF